MATSGQRVRLPNSVTEGSAAGSASRAASDRGGDGETGSVHNTLLSEENLTLADSFSVTTNQQSSLRLDGGDPQSMRVFVARLEALQAQQRSPQQPSPELDAELGRALAAYPEWRSRMAVATKSATLRKKILTLVPQGSRAVGSSALGGTHPWRQSQDKTIVNHFPNPGLSRSLSGYDVSTVSALSSTAEALPKHPLITNSRASSIPRSRRFPGTGFPEVDILEDQKRSTPGPGSYFKSQPRGTGFSMDGGETVILGANHICPWKKVLGHNINPVHVDGTVLRSSPCYSFSKMRRTVSEASVGIGGQDPGPFKTDLGCLSPGPIYEHYSSMRPAPQTGANKAFANRRRARSNASGPRVRMEPDVMEYYPISDDGSVFS